MKSIYIFNILLLIFQFVENLSLSNQLKNSNSTSISINYLNVVDASPETERLQNHSSVHEIDIKQNYLKSQDFSQNKIIISQPRNGNNNPNGKENPKRDNINLNILQTIHTKKDILDKSIVQNNKKNQENKTNEYINNINSNNKTDKLAKEHQKNFRILNLRGKLFQSQYKPEEYEEFNMGTIPYKIPENNQYSIKAPKANTYALDPVMEDKFSLIYDLLQKTIQSPFSEGNQTNVKASKYCNLNHIDFSKKRKIQSRSDCWLDEVFDPILRLCISSGCIPYDDKIVFE